MGFYLNKKFFTMILTIFLVFIVTSTASLTFDEKVTVGFTCDELQHQRDTHEAKFAQWKFQITTNRGGWFEVREQCNDLGGDLIYHNLGPEGEQYHEEIRDMVSGSPYHLWVGLSDLGKEGSFRLMNGTSYDAGDRSVKALYYWERNEPNGGDIDNCVHYYRNIDGFADTPCDTYVFSSEGIDFHGLCEIKSYNCLEEV